MRTILTVLLGVFLTTFAFAQEGFEAGIGGGTAHYFGDLNTEFDLGKPGATFGLFARYNFNERICAKLGVNYGTVYGDDSRSDNLFQQARNLDFQSTIADGTFQMEFNFLPYIHGSDDHFFTPYIFGGFSIANYNPRAEYRGELVDLRDLGTEGQLRGEEYYTLGGALVYGVGLKFDLNYEWSINIDINAHRMFSDYLDDVSTVYPDIEDLERERGVAAANLSDRSLFIQGVNESGMLSQPGRQRGNPSTKDTYVFTNISIVYYFGDLKCPGISRPY